MCDLLAVSNEHVPPKCLFPDSKDIKGINLRQNLITVPSCDIHNSAKSKDDEFLMVSLAGIFGNNSIGYQHKFTKVNRAIKRSSNRLLDAAFKERRHYILERDNEFLEVIWGTPDHTRLQECFRHIAYGLYYHHFEKRFKGQVKTLLSYLHSTDNANNQLVQFIKARAKIDLKGAEIHGKNPDVFYYQFVEPDEYGLFMLHIRLYGGIDVYTAFIPENKEVPFNFGYELMKTGIRTTILLDGKEYKIN
tara:strand:+ start:2132 stop:2875 length:744 start_codon:yes stop_codon:yes gene_type:complete